MRNALFLLLILLAPGLFAKPVDQIKRVVVFPLKVEKGLQKVADETWWDLREKMTENKRFLIASKNFMEVKDVFQPRGELVPSDVIILGRLLDSHALVTTVVQDSTVQMQAYETLNGSLLWQKKQDLNPSLPASKQVQEIASKMIYDFIASVPYHGAVIIDSLSAKTLYQEGGKSFFRAEVGVSSSIVAGAQLQVVRLKHKNLNPQFEGGVEVEVLAEGTIVKVDNNIVTVELGRSKNEFEIDEGLLVRIPDEATRMQKQYAMTSSNVEISGVQMLLDKQEGLTEKQKQKKPLYTALSFIGNLALFILLAF